MCGPLETAVEQTKHLKRLLMVDAIRWVQRHKHEPTCSSEASAALCIMW